MDEGIHAGIVILIPLVIVLTLLLVPVGRILRRTGHSQWWCLIAWIPLVNLVALWVFAFVDWPAVGKKPN